MPMLSSDVTDVTALSQVESLPADERHLLTLKLRASLFLQLLSILFYSLFFSL